MKQIPPALTSKTKFKDLLFPQKTIVNMMKRKAFKTARQLIPHKIMQETIKNLGLDKNKKKIYFLNLFKAIFYSITVKKSSFSRSIATVGKRKAGQMFSGLKPVSHVAILNALNSYEEEKIDALMCQINLGTNAATDFYSQASSKVNVLDGTTFLFSASRTGDELPKAGSGGSGKSNTDSPKTMMKLGLVISSGTYVPVDWQFSTDYDDNQVFRDLIDWTKKGYTYVIDRGNVAVDYLKKFTDNDMYFIQTTYEGHTFDKLWSKELPRTTKVNGRFDMLEEQLGWIIRQSDGCKVKVRRIIAFDEKNSENVSVTTNDLVSPNHAIFKKKDIRWDIEVVNDWIKNTIGPNDHHRLTQWKRLPGFRNLIRIFLGIAALLVAYAKKRWGARWRKPQRFSLGDVISKYDDQLSRWLEGKLGLRTRQYKSKMGV